MEGVARSNAYDMVAGAQSTSRSSKVAPDRTAAPPAATMVANASSRLQGRDAQQMDITTRQVREHLEQLGYCNIPSDVLEEFRQELVSRMASTPPTVQKQNSKSVLDKSQNVRQPAFASDKENNHKENPQTQALAKTDSSNFRIMSKPLSARNLDTHNQQNLQAARKDLVKSDAISRAPKSLKDMCDNMRPTTAPAMLKRMEEPAEQEPLVFDDAKQERGRAASARLRGTRLGAPAQRVPTGYEGDESEFDVERSEPEWGEGASEHGAAAASVGESSRQGARSAARGGGAASERGSIATCSVIRLAPHSMGRVLKKSDPVSGYWRARQSWTVGPAVSGARRQAVASPPSLKAPQDKRIWKATHPLENSTGHSAYQGPAAKSRGEERQRVHEALRREQRQSVAQQPRKTDRVHANEVVRQYVIPDNKRRDDVRWSARVMMCS